MKMNDNLIFYINKLSYLIVAQELESEKYQHQKRKGDQFFNNCVRKVRQKGCDVLLNRNNGTDIEDPCVTDYGGNWSPLTLISDYGRELKAQGAGKYNDLLISCITTLEEKEYDCVDDLLKLFVLLKRPLDKESSSPFQRDLSLKDSDFLLIGMDSLSFLDEEFSSEALSKTSSLKKAVHYEESWTKNFDSKFQLLGEFSKKNLLSPEKVSLKSILSSKAMVVTSQSRTNSFGFTDFFYPRNYKSEKSLFDINSNVYLSENPLLDSFVDRPISHKLPSLKLNLKYSSKNGFLEKSRFQIKTPPTGEEEKRNECTYNDENSRKSSAIELKRNSNCSHSFSILYEKSIKSQCWNYESNGSLTRSRNKMKEQKSLSPHSNSREIILGLWEQEQSLIKEFRPELAATFPSLRMITLVEFIEDVKYLFTGINSHTFKYDSEKQGFNMVYGTCLDDVTPESLFHFSRDFIEIGNSYTKLISCVHETGKNNFDTCTTISQAFWKSIFDYLELHYSLVLEIPVSINLMALKSCTRDLHEIITTVASICKVNSTKETLPQGGELLTYLLQIAERISKQCVTNIVFGILQNCANVYYMCILQNWMFKGSLDYQNNEFFVDYRRQKSKMKSRTYYNSFFLIEERIPSFLRGYEESFYNCGKSIHFLKLFNAEDTLCQLLEKGYYPSMQLCFSETQLEKLENDFKAYEERVLKLCGERITMKTIRNEEKERERVYQEYIRRCKMMQEKQREEARLKQLEEIKTKKEEQNKLLNEQRSAIESQKERKEQGAREEGLKLEAELKKSQETRENLLNKEKSLLKKYYGELMDTLEREIMLSQTRKENLREIISNTDDVINCNEVQTDEEGNITSRVDVNSNASSSNSEKLVKVTEQGTEIDRHVDNDSTKGSHENASISYDENSNPCVGDEANVIVEESGIRRSISYRTVAAEEAAKNKCKVLKSEFGLPVRIEPKVQPETKPLESMTDLERNRLRVLKSEYNILLKTETHISLTSVPQQAELVEENAFDGKNVTLKAEDDLKNSVFESVELERKQECTDLNQPPGNSHLAPSHSSDSYLTSSNDLSLENVSSTSEELRTPGSSSVVFNEKYQDALTRDLEIFNRKTSHQYIFCSLKEEEIDNLPCTDFLKFQKFLRESALIPLKVQEKLANDALLKHLLKGENLLSHLKSLRGYFFLNDGEFGRSFTHLIFRSLAKCSEPKQFFERSNLSNIVNEALTYTIHSSEPNSQNLSFRIVKMPPFLNHSSHDVLSPFELSYRVEWPLNFILTEKALAKYKVVFRFLLKLKRINWTLNENFIYLNSHFKNKSLNGKILVASVHYHKMQIFRHAMTQVMITLDDYFFSNGVQFPWINFLKDLETTENIDHLYQKHVRYIKDVLTRCFLSKNSEDLLHCIHNLIELALKFHYTSKSSVMELVGGRYEHPKFSVLKATFNEFCSVIKKFLKTLKEKISSNEVLRSHYVLIEKFDLKLT